MNPRRIVTKYWEYLVQMPRLLPILVFAFTLLLTVFSTFAFERSERATQQLRLQVKTDEVAASLEQNMATNVAILRSGRALFAALDTVDRNTFKRFVSELQAKNATISVRGIGWSAVVDAADVAAFENKTRSEGLKDFKVWPQTPVSSAKVHSIIYLEPMEGGNIVALGYNMFSDPTRRAAMQEAARSGLPAATTSVVLLVDSARHLPGFLVFVPVYRGNVSTLSPSIREARLEGFVYSAIRVSDLVNAVHINYETLDASVKIFDLSGHKLIYQTPDTMPGDYTAKQHIQVANRKWQLVLAAQRNAYLTPLAAVILALGIALSVLLGALTALILLGGRTAQQSLLARQEYETVRNVLTRELTHRVKNTLATVTSLAMLTRRGANSVDEYADALTSRLRALSATHDLLTQRDWSNAPLRDVIEAELAPFSKASDVRLNVSGPDVMLSPNIALSLGLAIHELVTNAAKYGAFSVKDGVITINWVMNNNNSVRLEWQESNGPRVVEPRVRGFGSDLVEKLMARELNSEVRINFHPEGVRCTLTVPILKDTGTI
jgi:two-component sensor histidine kinase/CHASE1-domain containing sensor protein